MRGFFLWRSRCSPNFVFRNDAKQFSKTFLYRSRWAKPLVRASMSFSASSTSASSASKHASTASSFSGVIIGLVSGCVLGVGIGFLFGKYPFVTFKAGLKQKPEAFIIHPDLRRVTKRSDDEDDEQDSNQLDRFLKICEAVIKIAEIAILTSISERSADTSAAAKNTSLSTYDSVDSPTLPPAVSPQPCPESRPVYPFPVDPGIPLIHFSTNKYSRKLRQLQSNSEVTLTYLDKEGAGYVTVKGNAEILSAGESATLWRDELILYYPEGPPSSSAPSSRFVVVRIHPKRIEFCSSRFGVETAHDSWLPTALNRSGDGWRLAPENKIL